MDRPAYDGLKVMVNYVTSIALAFIVGAGITATVFTVTAKTTVVCPGVAGVRAQPQMEWHDQPMTGSKQW